MLHCDSSKKLSNKFSIKRRTNIVQHRVSQNFYFRDIDNIKNFLLLHHSNDSTVRNFKNKH